MHPAHATTLRRSFLSFAVSIVSVLFASGSASAELLLNDGWFDGGTAAFQQGFVAGEIGASRLVPTEACPCVLNTVELLFGGAGGQQAVTLRIWDDSALTDNPGPELFSGDYVLTGADDAINVVDLSGENIVINGPIRVGIQFQHSGAPSIARDTDGTIDVTRNFIFTAGTWFRSSLFGVTGDWIIRATTIPSGGGFSVGGVMSGFAGDVILQNNGGDDLLVSSDGPFTFPTALSDGSTYDVTVLSAPDGVECSISNGSGTINGSNVNDILVDCGSTVLRNDGWEDGLEAAFQGGFLAGEIGAVRLVPTDPCPCDLNRVELLFGGESGAASVILRIWEDTNEELIPGPELFSGEYQLTGADDAINVIDLSSENISVSGAFRVGIEFLHSGYPSIARDSDGTINVDRNFIFTAGTWFRSSFFGLTGDWIIRAALDGSTTSIQVESPASRLLVSPSPYRGGDLRISFGGTVDGAGTGPRADDEAIELGDSIELAIYDVRGRLVRELDAGPGSASIRDVIWDGRDAFGSPARSGTYFVRVVIGPYVWSKKVTVLR